MITLPVPRLVIGLIPDDEEPMEVVRFRSQPIRHIGVYEVWDETAYADETTEGKGQGIASGRYRR